MLSAQDIKSVKGLGFLHNRGTNTFSARIITENGMLTADQIAILSEAAKLYGNGNITFTVRMTVEVQGVDFENIQPFREYIKKGDMITGGTGAKVRPVVSCKGSTCVFGLYDTHSLAKEIHDEFFDGYSGVSLPHKYKIAVGGCPNNCVKPDLNDIGIVGQRVIKRDMDKCRGCKKCAVMNSCPMKCVSMDNKKIVVDDNECNNCGRCLSKCPFGVTNDFEEMYKVYIGGRWGKKVRMGTPLSRLFTKAEILDVVEKSILLFKSYGLAGERFGDTVDRIGVDKVEALLIGNELLENKDDILECIIKATI